MFSKYGGRTELFQITDGGADGGVGDAPAGACVLHMVSAPS